MKRTAASTRINVVTYNIHRCVGRDGLQAPERIAAVIRETEAGIVALQEVDSSFQPPARRHQLDYLAQATRLQGIAGPVTLRPDGHYGNALLTNAPVLEVRRHDITVPGREPRGVLEVDLQLHGRELRVIVAHLGLRPAERRIQVARLLNILDSVPGTPTLLLGDFNEWLWWGRPLRWLGGRMGPTYRHRTFPSGLPLFALDKIWAAPAGMLSHVQVHHSKLARIASDHLPITAVCRLPEARGTHGSTRARPASQVTSTPSRVEYDS